MSEQLQPELPAIPKVFLWTPARSLSGAFCRSIGELPQVKIIYEPHMKPYINSTNIPGLRTTNIDPSSQYDPSADHKEYHESCRTTDETLLDSASDPDCKAVFIKNLAFYVEGRYNEYTQRGFARFKHTFLIRHPAKSCISYYKAVATSKLYTFRYPGLCQVYELYQAVKQVDPNPFVLDADDLLENPREMMQLYCSATGLTFTEDMLTWKAGDLPPQWQRYDLEPENWVANAVKSSGFVKPTKKQKADEICISNYPEIVQKSIASELPFYELLHQVRVRL